MTQNHLLQLRDLLNRKGAISLPGIGTFLRTHKPAIFHAEGGELSPPGETYRFKKEVDISVLFSKILTEAQFLHIEISEQIEAELSEYLRHQLRLDGTVNVPGVGSLSGTSLGELVFSPLFTENERTSDHFFGLKSLDLPQKPKRSGIPEITMDPMNNGTTTYKQIKPKNSINWQPYLLVGLLVLIGVLVIYNGPFLKSSDNPSNEVFISEEQATPFEEEYASANRSSGAPTTQKEIVSNSPSPQITASQQGLSRSSDPVPPPAQNDSKSEAVEGVVESQPNARERGVNQASELEIVDANETGNLSALQTENIPVSTPLTPGKTVYHLISASFTMISSAEDHAREMKDQGFKPEIILPGNGPSQIHRVSIFQSNDQQQVRDLQQQLEQSGRELLWIYQARPSE